MKTITRWKKKHEFESWQDQHSILIDGSRQHGISPKALLLCGLAGCSGVDVVDILTKMRVDFSELEIDVETTQTEENPRVFRDIHITYKLKTTNACLLLHNIAGTIRLFNHFIYQITKIKIFRFVIT